MQAIARANRVNKGKNNGLIVDCCGILKNLRKALATFAGHQGGDIIDDEQSQPEVDPVKPEEDLLEDLAEAIGLIRGFFETKQFRLEDILEKTGFESNKAIMDAKEIINENDRTRSRIDFERLRKEFECSPAKHTTVQNLKVFIEKKLHRMILQNPLRTDMQKHYEQIVEAYNREKDRATIEKTFEELMRFVDSLDQESQRAMREGLDEEALALFDLLVKPNLSKKDITRIKKVAKDLLATLKAEKLKIDSWQEKEATRDAVKIEIMNFLWNEDTGLPTSYSVEEIEQKAEAVYFHIFQVYTDAQPTIYAEVA